MAVWGGNISEPLQRMMDWNTGSIGMHPWAIVPPKTDAAAAAASTWIGLKSPESDAYTSISSCEMLISQTGNLSPLRAAVKALVMA